MNRRLPLIICLFAYLCSVTLAYSQQGQYVMLPASATAQFLRSNVIQGAPLGGYWEPATRQLAELETNLPKIAALRSEGALAGNQIGDPLKYNRQYVAFLLNGKKTLYINAFCVPPMKEWSSRLETIFDGGSCVWHVLYDVETQAFSHLTTNGVA
jgi:hypothetical protein